jgi:fructan beta-fructosidase
MKRNNIYYLITLLLMVCSLNAAAQQPYKEKHRPQFHFSPPAKWMNDPNGMVYHKGVYHLFYQYFPDGTTWGPMHWGHATSKDLVSWQNKPTALFPDSLGYIFSGSAVVDSLNTTGFAKNGETPLVAIFTHHSPKPELEKIKKNQYQSLAYSLDDGETWTKYEGNPVLENPGIIDFRDPKVMWHKASKKWIMTLATKDRITFYSSPNLKDWQKESEFGSELGAHGGVWECPDLFPLDLNGKQVWVLLVSINPGAPNGGSGTQYFTGVFDGKTFVPDSEQTKFLDYGTDNYAGITWSNTGERKIFLGWMNNWQYANVVPTEAWRGAATLPRDLKLVQVNGQHYVSSSPVKELERITKPVYEKRKLNLKKELDLSTHIANAKGQFQLDLTFNAEESFNILLSNKSGQKLTIGYDHETKQYFIDRTQAGQSDFEAGFAKKHLAPRISVDKRIQLTLIADAASVELFADHGLTVMTDVFFPEETISILKINSAKKNKLSDLVVSKIESIY